MLEIRSIFRMLHDPVAGDGFQRGEDSMVHAFAIGFAKEAAYIVLRRSEKHDPAGRQGGMVNSDCYCTLLAGCLPIRFRLPERATSTASPAVFGDYRMESLW